MCIKNINSKCVSCVCILFSFNIELVICCQMTWILKFILSNLQQTTLTSLRFESSTVKTQPKKGLYKLDKSLKNEENQSEEDPKLWVEQKVGKTTINLQNQFLQNYSNDPKLSI